MRVHLRLDKHYKEHAHMTLFINGKNTGRLCMSPGEALLFRDVLENGSDIVLDEVEIQGDFHELSPDEW